MNLKNVFQRIFKCFYNMGFSEKNYQKEIGNMERWKEVFAGIIPESSLSDAVDKW